MRTILPVLLIIVIVALASRRRRQGAAASTQRAAGAGAVSIDADGVTYAPRGGNAAHLAWSALQHVHVETVAGGLNADDVTWVLEGSGGQSLRISQTAPGADLMIARLQQLEGFRYEPMIESMITTDATRFVVWERR